MSAAIAGTDRATMLPGLAESILRGKQGTQSDGLEICKQAVALLVGDIRAEVQQAVAALRSEASSVATTGANVDVRANQPQMSKKLLGVAETLQSAEQDALGKLRELMKSTNWELGQRLDKQMQVNAKLGDHMHNSWEQILEVVKRLEVKMQQLEETVQNSSESLTKDVSSVSTALQGVASQIGQNTGDLHDLGNTHYRDLKTIGQQITETNNEIYERMKKSDASLGSSLQRLDDLANSSTAKLTKVVESQDSLATAASHIAQDLHRLQQQDDKHYVDLGLSLETQLSVHGSRISDLQASTSRIFEPVQADVLRIRRQVNSDSRAMLAEIGRIQKALNVEYVTLQDSTRKGAFKDEIESLATDNLDMDAKRSRDYFTQTDLASTKESFMMTDPVQFESDGKKKKKKPDEKKKDDLKAKMKKSAFAGADKLLQQATMAAMQKPYNVFDYYWEEGFAQRLAKSNHFDSITLLMVFVNALWIAVDTDLNKASNLLRADAIFLIMENVFTIFFSFELTVRFLAFQDKMRCLKDYWFLFDSCLVTIAILETWVIPVATLSLDGEGGGTGMNVARLIRLVRLLRLTRLGRLLRAAPELVIIMKGLAFASRSVLVFFALWVIVAYVFAILFRSLTDETDVGTSYFATVPESLNLLLLHGIFGSNANLVIGITAGNPALWPIIVFFMTLVSVTILYMLVGVLVDVIGAVATAEKEKLGVSHIVTQLRDQLETLGLTDSMEITQHEFQNLIIEPGIIRVIQEAGVDVAVLADMLDLVFEDVAAKGRGLMNFTDLVNVVLNMRGTNPATVKDCKEQIRVTKTLMRQQMDELMEELNEQFKSLRSEIQAIDMDFDEEDA